MNSRVAPPGSPVHGSEDFIGFSEDVSTALEKLKKFNYQSIYLNPLTKRSAPLIRDCYENLFVSLVRHQHENARLFPTGIDMINEREEMYPDVQPPEAMVRDFIAGMTDDFFLKQAAAIGCTIPIKQ
jgi:dGTPase